VRSRIVTLLAVPLVAFALLAAGAGPASAMTDTDSDSVIFHARGQLQLPGPASTGQTTDDATISAETCYWDVYIFRADSTGRISGKTEVPATR